MPANAALRLRGLGGLLMAGDLVQWLAGSSPAEREAERALAQMRREADLAAARVGAVMQVSQAAMFGALSVAMAKREAALLVPEDAAKFDLVATQAALAMAAQIGRVS